MAVHTHPRAAAGDHQRVDPGRRQRGLQRRAVDGLAGDQAFGAVAMRRIHVLVHVRRHRPTVVGGDRRAAMQAHRARAAVHVFGDALQPVDEPARPGIDHPGLLQHRHLFRGIGQGRACPLQRAGEAALGIGHLLLRGFVQRIGERRDHAEDGALDRLRQRRARAVSATPYRPGQAGGIQHRCVACLFGQADQELRHDRAGIAARAVDGVVADPDQQFADVAAAPAQRALQHAAQGRGEVAAGIAVGHREHVDAVEFVAGRDHPAGARDQRPAQRRGGHVGGVGSGHGHARSLRSMGAQCLLRRNNATFLACPASTL